MRLNSKRWLLSTLLLALSVGSPACKPASGRATPSGAAQSATPERGTTPQFVRARVRRNPTMVVSAFVDVEAPGADHISVRHGQGADAIETPDLAVGPSGRVTAIVLGLKPGANTEITVQARAGDHSLTSTVPYQADALPPDIDFPETRVKVDDGTARGFLLAAFRTGKGKLAAMFDRRGRVMWYRPILGEDVLGPFMRLPDGNFVVWNRRPRVFEEVDLSGWVVRRWVVDPPASVEGADGHEFLPLPNGGALVIGWQSRHVDTRRFFPKGGVADAERRDNTIVELDGAGAARVIWSTYPDVGLDELQPLPQFPVNPSHVEVAHVNSIDLSADGGVVAVTCRQLGQVIGVERATGKIRWRLGGKRSTLRITGDALDGFSAPHDARFLPGNRLRVFDNGNLHEPPVSRVVIYELDESKREARMVWEYRHDPPLFTKVEGSARDVPGERLLVDFTRNGRITEIDSERRVHWEMKLEAGAYRVEWVPTPYPPVVTAPAK